MKRTLINSIFHPLFLITLFSIFPLACTTQTESPISKPPNTSTPSQSESDSSLTPNSEQSQLQLESELTPQKESDSLPPLENIIEQPSTVFEINDLVYFNFDSAALTVAAQTQLRKISSQLKDRQQQIMIAGHADERGSRDYNLDLGRRRAETVKDFLATLGVDSTRLSSVSYGETQPLVPQSHPQAWAKNRRVDFRILSSSQARLKEIAFAQPVTLSNINNLVYFDFDSAWLTPAAKTKLRQISTQLKDNQRPIAIAGHTDRHGSDEYNQDLGRRRAETVKDFLATLGVDPALLSTLSYGETKPEPELAPAQNRRVEITIIPPTQARHSH